MGGGEREKEEEERKGEQEGGGLPFLHSLPSSPSRELFLAQETRRRKTPPSSFSSPGARGLDMQKIKKIFPPPLNGNLLDA